MTKTEQAARDTLCAAYISQVASAWLTTLEAATVAAKPLLARARLALVTHPGVHTACPVGSYMLVWPLASNERDGARFEGWHPAWGSLETFRNASAYASQVAYK